MKHLLKLFIHALFDLLGYNITIGNNKRTSHIVVDRFVWEPFVALNPIFKLYLNAQSQSRNEANDNFYKQLRYYSLHQIIRHVVSNKIPGDIAECGVWKGHSAFIIASIFASSNQPKEFHIFDSFEGGLSAKVPEDKAVVRPLSEAQVELEKKQFSSTEAQVQDCLKSFPFIHLHSGWIPQRFSAVENKQFCFVHIDVDLFEPTRDSLNFFWPKLVPGGAIVVDDYSLSQFPGCKAAVDKFLSQTTVHMFYEVPLGACFIIK